MVSKRLLLAAAALAALALAGCSSTGLHSAFIPHADRAGLDPLLMHLCVRKPFAKVQDFLPPVPNLPVFPSNVPTWTSLRR